MVGLTQNKSALDRFCLVAPILASLSEDFCKHQGISTTYRTCHYQLSGSTQSRVTENTKKLLTVMGEFDVSFNEEHDAVFNVISKAVLPTAFAKEVLDHESIGQRSYESFVKTRFHGSLSVWDPMKKTNLKSFKANNKKIKKKVGEKVIQLREEKTLLTRFLIAARKRPELDLEESFGNYEFTVVPKSLFSSDGQPLTCTDKSSILHHIEDLSNANNIEIINEENVNPRENRIIVIDGMAAVNQIDKTEIQSCKVNTTLINKFLQSHIAINIMQYCSWE